MGDMQEKHPEDFESLMVRKRAKEQIEDSSWSEVKIADVNVYSGYEFADARVARETGSSTTVRGTISADDPSTVIDQMKQEDLSSYKAEVPRFMHSDGATTHNDRKYVYRKRKWIIVSVESENGLYSEDYVVTRTPKFEKNDLEDVYRKIASQIGKEGSIGSPPDSRRDYLRSDKILNKSNVSMIMGSMLRLGILGTSILAGFFISTGIMFTTGSLALGSALLGSIVLLASYLQHRMYEGWFEIAPIDWIDSLPESANITDKLTQKMDKKDFSIKNERRLDYMNTEGEVHVESDGTLILTTPMSKWVFESKDDGIPSEKAEEIYKSYGRVNFSEIDEIPVQIAKNDNSTLLSDNEYLSEDGDWVLKVESL